MVIKNLNEVKMTKNKKTIIMILSMFLVLLISVGGFVYIGGNSIGNSNKNQKYWHNCDVTVKEKLLGKNVELTATCENTGKKCGSIFGFFSSEGTIELWDSNGKLASKDYETEIFSGKDSISIRGCSDGTDLKLKAYDENHNVLTTIEV